MIMLAHFAIFYLLIGLGVYMGVAAATPDSFAHATAAGIIRGLLLGVIAWPMAVVIVTILRTYEERKKFEARE